MNFAKQVFSSYLSSYDLSKFSNAKQNCNPFLKIINSPRAHAIITLLYWFQTYPL